VEKILDIIDSIAYEKSLNPDIIKTEVKEALIATVKFSISDEIELSAEIDEEHKKLVVYQKLLIVPDKDERIENKDCFISLSDAKAIDNSFSIDSYVEYELDIENLGRTAANFLHKEIENRVQRLIEQQLFDKLKAKEGKIITGSVVRVDDRENTYVELNEVRGVISQKNRIKGESFKVGDVVKSILKYVHINSYGINIELSRTTPKFLEELLTLEVPEVKDGAIEIVKSARIPGIRAKIAVMSHESRVDAIGSIVGVKGIRINAVSKELNGESIDAIEYTDRTELFIARALSPAIVRSVVIKDGSDDNKEAIVTLAEDQKSKAIGKAGINIRLAIMLTGHQIQIQEGTSSEPTTPMEQDIKTASVDDLASLFK
jgi:N utilization substance protein A